MDDWNKPFTDEELVAIDAAFEAAADSLTPPSSSFHLKASCMSSSDYCRFPCVTRSSKPALAPHRCLAEPNCNGQWRCSSRSSSKWPFYQEPRMALHGRPKKRFLEQHTCSSPLRLQINRPRVVPMPMAVKEVEACMARKWDEMDHDILVTIMKCLVQGPYLQKLFALYRSFLVCKSWRSAVLDSLFPPGNVLDLRYLETVVEKKERCYYQFFLKFLLQRPHQYTKLFYPATNLKNGADTYIAQRLSTLKCLVHLPRGLPFFVTLSRLFPYWPELNEAHCDTLLIHSLSVHCKYMRRLDLVGRIGNDAACRIAYHFPHLIHLNIQSCILSRDALPIILQGQRDLSYLDTRHACCINPPLDRRFKDSMWGLIEGRVIEWDEEEVLQKAVGVKTYLHCARKRCSDCAPLYSPPNIALS